MRLKWQNYLVKIAIVNFFLNNTPLNIFPKQLREKNIIKAYIASSEDSQPHWDSLREIKDEIEKYNLSFIDKMEDADVVLCSDMTENLLKSQIPVIICDIIDSCVVHQNLLHHLKNPNVKALFKNFSVKHVELNNAPRIFWGYHFKLINDYYDPETKPIVPDKLPNSILKKIKCIPWDPSHSMIRSDLNILKTETIDFHCSRPIDIFFAGKITYNLPGSEVPQVFWHRQKAIEIIRNMKNIKSFIIEGDFPLPFDKYIETMKRSKIVISPWGYGEWCWRDFEGMLCGSVVIKPYTPYIKSNPSIYIAGKTYIACKPDFSDLEEKIYRVLNNWPYYMRIRKKAHSLIIKSNVKDFAKTFVDGIRTSLMQ